MGVEYRDIIQYIYAIQIVLHKNNKGVAYNLFKIWLM